jgi:hypothetical protein
MSKSFAVPASIEEATRRLGGLDKLITASKWERAAIVYAFTRDGQAEPNRYDGKYTIKDFAAIGIAGLRSTETVRRYRESWKQGGGDLTAAPGRRVRLPTEPFPTFLDSLGQAGRSTRGEKRPWRERIVNQAEKALQIVNNRAISDDDFEALEKTHSIYAEALSIAKQQKADRTPASKSDWLTEMRRGLGEALEMAKDRDQEPGATVDPARQPSAIFS